MDSYKIVKYKSVILVTLILIISCSKDVSGMQLVFDHGPKMDNWSQENNVYLYTDLKDLPIDRDPEYSIVMTFSSFTFEVHKKFTYVAEAVIEILFPATVYSLVEYKKAHRWTDDYTFYLVVMDDYCAAQVGVPVIIDMKEAGTDVIMGVPCSMITKPAGYYLKHWNLPLISSFSNDPLLANKDIYSTLIRLGIGYTYLGAAFLEVFKAFRWTTVSLLLRDAVLCKFGGSSIDQAFKENGILVTEYARMNEDVNDAEIVQYLRNFKERARILIVCHHDHIVKRIMELVDEEGMNVPGYVYLTFYISPSYESTHPWGDTTGLTEDEIKKRRSLFQHVKTLTPSDITGPEKFTFLQQMEDTIEREYPMTITIPKEELRILNSPPALYQYDIMQLYLNIFNKTLNEGYDIRKNGSLVFEKAKNRIFKGASGEVILNDEADRIPNYWLWQLEPDAESFHHFASIRVISEEGKRLQTVAKPSWGTDNGQPPPSTPKCGFRHELCPSSNNDEWTALYVGLAMAAAMFITVMVSALYYRQKKHREELQKMVWKVEYEDIQFTSRRALGSMTGTSMKSVATGHSKSLTNPCEQQIFTKVAILKNVLCAVKRIRNIDYKPSTMDLIELKNMKDLNHENINPFIGLSVHSSDVLILSQYCSKGSLEDILLNDDIKLDKMFKSSLINDLANGMAYLHQSTIQSHGHLKSSNCLIDSRWTLKISNFGISGVRSLINSNSRPSENTTGRDELWMAPELMRLDTNYRPAKGTKKADVYSFAILMQEILYRAPPYYYNDMEPNEIIQRLKAQTDPPFRPKIPTDNEEAKSEMTDIMFECWEESPIYRPDFKAIKKKLIENNKGRKINILDNMVARLETYANNLEEIVQKRTEELMEEKKKTDILLYRMLPSSVAEKLKHGLVVAPEMYEKVTIYFSDIVGFTSIASESVPMQIVEFLNDLYTLFDDVIEKYDVYKVETIGDAYMCVSGLPNRNGDRHAMEIANMSLDLRDCLERFKIRHLPERALHIRIGLHTGSCAAGIVGLTMPRFCLFGDTVNVASRMESNGEAMKIHISAVTHDMLHKTGQYVLEVRGEMDLKGKGKMICYWLEGKA